MNQYSSPKGYSSLHKNKLNEDLAITNTETIKGQAMTKESVELIEDERT